ncbi:extradiol dioxygenase [Pseudomonas gingeri NCPPB 3146 = LMG 5327]|uniref:VOC family protein n=2 Tax=Pseudomonas gingeri TaxID=117681 RepID=A0A7Y7Y5U0_9PSED|nr:VOC family protein [Pseudomonas gingeri]NVZ65181.1 VOC family protein [Pseudomonas gingeri]NVZ74728.1 VOC family protein [Pseudomonas gingeri]NWA10083.1 VOC family protein [Pseudomonas gingeri]NWC18399.1 VOC family protein [Pseudomonas gingeri]NWE72437.1 VOC family protein [Pseudomonas gingeri]
MTIQHLDHFTLRTSRVDETVAFFRDAIGLEVGWRPAFPFPGQWLYAGERALLHIADLDRGNSELEAYLGARVGGGGTGALDHIAFRCSDLPGMRQRLRDLGLPFDERVVPDLAEHQLFVEDPNGIGIELIFAYSPPASR